MACITPFRRPHHARMGKRRTKRTKSVSRQSIAPLHWLGMRLRTCCFCPSAFDLYTRGCKVERLDGGVGGGEASVGPDLQPSRWSSLSTSSSQRWLIASCTSGHCTRVSRACVLGSCRFRNLISSRIRWLRETLGLGCTIRSGDGYCLRVGYRDCRKQQAVAEKPGAFCPSIKKCYKMAFTPPTECGRGWGSFT